MSVWGVGQMLGIFILTTLFSQLTLAENSWFVSLWNQSESKKYCRQVVADDVRHLANQCYGLQHLDDKNLNLVADDVLQWVIYQEAIKLQVQKDRCLVAQLQLLSSQNGGCNLWHQKTVMAWLASRQVRLKDVKNLIKNSDELFRMSVPLINNQELLHDIDDNRNDIWLQNPAPGHAITDSEIMGLNFESDEQFKNLNINCKGKMISHLNTQLQAVAKERLEILSEIEATKPVHSSHYAPTEDIKNRLYEEGTLHQVLIQEGLLGPNERSVKKSPAAACVLAYHDANIAAELTEFAGTAAAGMAGATQVLAKSAGFIKLSRLKKLKEIAGYGLLPAGVPLFIDEIKRKCFGIQSLPSKQVYVDGSKINLTGVLNLPKDSHFEEIDISSQLTKIPICKGLQIKSWAASEASPVTQSDCAFHLLISSLPIRYAIPMMFLNNSQ